METTRITGASNRVITAALRVINSDYDLDSSTDLDAEHAQEQLALAALSLVEAVDAASAGERPVGWRDGKPLNGSAAQRLIDAIWERLRGNAHLQVTQVYTPHPDGTPAWGAIIVGVQAFELDGKAKLPDDDLDADRDRLAATGDTPDEAVADLLRLFRRCTFIRTAPTAQNPQGITWDTKPTR